MSSKDSDSSSDCDDHKKDPTFRAKVQVEDTDRSTRQTGSNLAKTAKKVVPGSSKASVAKVVTVSSLETMVDTKQVLIELKEVFKDVTKQNKHDNVLTLNELPYFGIPQSEDIKKWIIPLDDCLGFLETIEKQTEDVDFSDLGRIRVLKPHLLGSAQAYWKGYKGNPM